MPFDSILVLEDGSIFHGEGFGEEKVDVGEIVFNTSMTGYQEIITDPSYKKQIITFTHPHIGNTGINAEDHESNKIHASGLVVKEFCTKPSNWRSQKTLEEFLIEQNVMAISRINTRQLTQIIREKGSMACCIGSSRLVSEAEALQKAKSFSGLEGLDLAKEVSSAESYKWNQGVWPEYKESSNKNGPIVAYDFGIKTNILRLLSDYAGEVHVVNAKTSFDEVMELSPRGIFLSNGPGDPEPCTYAIENIKKGKESGDMSLVMNQGIMKLRAVIDRDSNNIAAIYQLGIMSIESGQTEKAVKRFEKLLLLQPENQEYKKILADLKD